jgi:hypothetical protein
MSSTIADGDTVLKPIGIVTGAYLILAGIGTVVGAPWATNNSAVLSGLQLLGVLGTVAIGAALVWLLRGE